jgi:hypothetical protein
MKEITNFPFKSLLALGELGTGNPLDTYLCYPLFHFSLSPSPEQSSYSITPAVNFLKEDLAPFKVTIY